MICDVCGLLYRAHPGDSHLVFMYGHKEVAVDRDVLHTFALNDCTAAAFVAGDMIHMIHHPAVDLVVAYINRAAHKLQSPVWIKTPATRYAADWSLIDGYAYFKEAIQADLNFLPYGRKMTIRVAQDKRITVV